jgi:four helix bundle protein
MAFSRPIEGFDSPMRYQFLKAVERRKPRVEEGSWNVRRRLEEMDGMRTQFRFEKLEVWQEARKVSSDIYRLTRKFPNHEMFAMTSQLRRASVSISCNIAEGSGRNSDKDFAHFLEQAYGSLMETVSILHLAADEKYILNPELEPLLDGLEKLARRIAALNRSLEVKNSKTPFTRRNGPAFDPRPSTLDPS